MSTLAIYKDTFTFKGSLFKHECYVWEVAGLYDFIFTQFNDLEGAGFERLWVQFRTDFRNHVFTAIIVRYSNGSFVEAIELTCQTILWFYKVNSGTGERLNYSEILFVKNDSESS